VRQFIATDPDSGEQLLVTVFEGGGLMAVEVARRLDATRWGAPFVVVELPREDEED
jgi:hypothetical protein